MSKHYRWFTVGALAFFTACAGLAYLIESKVTFPEGAAASERCTLENRKNYSIILMWLWADLIISYFSIVTVFLDYFFGKRQDVYNMKEYIALAKRNAVKKFYENNLPYSDISLKG